MARRLVWSLVLLSVFLLEAAPTSAQVPDLDAKPPAVVYVEAKEPPTDAELAHEQRRLTIIGSMLLGVGLTGIALAPVAANATDNAGTAAIVGLAVAVPSLALAGPGLSLLIRRRKIKKQRQRSVVVTFGPRHLLLWGKF
ncbi:MAG: hypothetical protein WBG86_20200 [Polyangiales bacterium]